MPFRTLQISFTTMDAAIAQWNKHGFKITAVNLSSKMRVELRIELICMTGVTSFTFFAKMEYDNLYLARVDNFDQFMSEEIDTICLSMIENLPQNVAGKYPLIRFYADTHLSLGSNKLMFHPELEIPGWVFGRYKKKFPGGQKTRPVTMEIHSGMDITEPPDSVPIDFGKPRKPAPLTLSLDEEEGLIMATKTKKKIVKKAPIQGFDPDKVKKPECKGGGAGGPHPATKMKFDPIKGKWICTHVGCKMVARPVRDEDDRSVQIGKGETSLRVVATEDEIRVLLISDDNLALDITDLVGDMERFLNSIGALELARAADDNGLSSFVDRTPRQVVLNLRIGGLGVEHLFVHFDD